MISCCYDGFSESCKESFHFFFRGRPSGASIFRSFNPQDLHPQKKTVTPKKISNNDATKFRCISKTARIPSGECFLPDNAPILFGVGGMNRFLRDEARSFFSAPDARETEVADPKKARPEVRTGANTIEETLLGTIRVNTSPYSWKEGRGTWNANQHHSRMS